MDRTPDRLVVVRLEFSVLGGAFHTLRNRFSGENCIAIYHATYDITAVSGHRASSPTWACNPRGKAKSAGVCFRTTFCLYEVHDVDFYGIEHYGSLAQSELRLPQNYYKCTFRKHSPQAKQKHNEKVQFISRQVGIVKYIGYTKFSHNNSIYFCTQFTRCSPELLLYNSDVIFFPWDLVKINFSCYGPAAKEKWRPTHCLK